jgi:flagellar basal body-associated protein FliL
LDNSDRYEEAGKIPAVVWIALAVVVLVGVVTVICLVGKKKKARQSSD